MPAAKQSVEKVVNAFVALVNEKDYNSITITELAKCAGVSRMTFYRQFSSKEDVAKEFVKSAGNKIVVMMKNEKRVWDMREYFSILFKKVAIYNKLIKELYYGNMGEYILTYMNEILFSTPTAQGTVHFERYKARFYAGAFYNVVIEWVLSGMNEPAENMAEIYSCMIV